MTSDTTMEVVVREGMRFHDDTPVTMEDVLYSFELPTHKDKTPQFFPFVSNIAKVEQTGPKTILFTLKAPQASFPTTTLSKINIIPKHVWEPLYASMQGKSDMLENFNEAKHIGSGPFKFNHWRQSEEVMLDRFDAHWSPPKLDRWIMRIVPNQEATLGMLKTGELNFLAIFTGDPRVLAELPKQAPQVKVVTTTDLGFQFSPSTTVAPPSTTRPSAAPSAPPSAAHSSSPPPITASRSRRLLRLHRTPILALNREPPPQRRSQHRQENPRRRRLHTRRRRPPLPRRQEGNPCQQLMDGTLSISQRQGVFLLPLPEGEGGPAR